MQEQK
jgi:hypothetical protein